ncbi:hypothetical protein FYJ85_19355 [Victivallaceae bacterium BBE-744-WT-12]|uniref:Uncharacterized protein n=1 Tax=Victivallis lenta TaxID=2606640 RepID=A0A844G5P6_9BACT|nr:hypothetical protein [Victivallis lenta]AVM46577.1 hypothetical protein C5Q97_18410 [Victivallales bacterium CCUG 44730]MST99190.1 hypothetical protein [Victivallis lenta]HBP05406.1 hypothetical protein [Lentisphaeria bacterium]HCH84798.1 hypothetical protein [Lentisphaeria bacterium]
MRKTRWKAFFAPVPDVFGGNSAAEIRKALLPTAVALPQFACYIVEKRGCAIERPRNPAGSVTVG